MMEDKKWLDAESKFNFKSTSGAPGFNVENVFSLPAFHHFEINVGWFN